jgi:DNA-binding CsgD family transcriptional regulator
MGKYQAFNFDPTANNGRPFLRSDFLTDREFYHSDIYAEGFRLARLSDHAAMHVPTSENTIFFVGVERSGRGRFVEDDRLRLDLIQPHLTNARQLALAHASLETAVSDPAAFTRVGLSPREADVLLWMAQGKTNLEIGAILHLRLQTVKGYVAAIFNKLGVDNRHAAILRALEFARRWRAGVSTPPDGPVRVAARVPRR